MRTCADEVFLPVNGSGAAGAGNLVEDELEDADGMISLKNEIILGVRSADHKIVLSERFCRVRAIDRTHLLPCQSSK